MNQQQDTNLLSRYPFLKDGDLSDDLKKFLVEKSVQTETAAWSNQLEVKKWRWSTPLAIALTGVITISANFAVDYWKASQKHTFEDQTGDSEAKRKAAAAEREFQYKIVERELSQDKPEKDRARVLLFLVRSGVLNGLNAGELRQMAEDTLNNKAGASVPSLGTVRQNLDARRMFCNFTYQTVADSPGMIEISSDWLSGNIIEVEIPQLTKFITSGKVRFNKIAATALKNAFLEIEAKGLLDRVLSWDGGFVPRSLTWNPNRPPSVHACGIAFDINARWNSLGRDPTPAGAQGSVVDLVPIFEKYGFEWGGRWVPNAREGMHFEFVVSSAN